MLRLLPAVALLAVLPPGPESAARGVASDVKYIKCAACEAAVTAAHELFTQPREAGAARAQSEEEAHQLVEQLCKPEAEEGAWMRAIDLVEQQVDGGGRRLALVKMEEDGPCGQECLTIAMACESLVGAFESELAEALYAGAADAADLRARACNKWSPVCRKPPPKLDDARADGPPFRAYTLEELAEREQGAPPPPGVLSADALRARLGVAPTGGVGGGATFEEQEAWGRGEHAPAALEHSTAFVELAA